MTPRIPLTLITGYLGAGKTTLLNALLRDASAGRIAVVVNEFGDVGLDHDLIVETTEETVLLASGCMCCTVRGDLVQALEGLLGKRSAGKLDFDRIVVETTGLADPAPILHTLIVTPGLSTALQLDGVVTVCDAVNGPVTLDRGFESVRQVAMADVLVLSKCDLVTESQAARFRARLFRSRRACHGRGTARGRGMDQHGRLCDFLAPIARRDQYLHPVAQHRGGLRPVRHDLCASNQPDDPHRPGGASRRPDHFRFDGL
jgi:G3E family GTPase